MRSVIFFITLVFTSIARSEPCPEIHRRDLGNWSECSCQQKKEAMTVWSACHLLKNIVHEYDGGWLGKDDPQACKYADYPTVHSRAKNYASEVMVDEVRLNYLVGKEWNTWCSGENIYDFSQIRVPLSAVKCTKSGKLVTAYKKCRSNW